MFIIYGLSFLASQKDWMFKKIYSSSSNPSTSHPPTPPHPPPPNYLPGKISSFPYLENPEVCVSAKG